MKKRSNDPLYYLCFKERINLFLAIKRDEGVITSLSKFYHGQAMCLTANQKMIKHFQRLELLITKKVGRKKNCFLTMKGKLVHDELMMMRAVMKQ